MWGQEFEQGIFYLRRIRVGRRLNYGPDAKTRLLFEVIDQVLNYEPFESIEDYGWDEEHRI